MSISNKIYSFVIYIHQRILGVRLNLPLTIHKNIKQHNSFLRNNRLGVHKRLISEKKKKTLYIFFFMVLYVYMILSKCFCFNEKLLFCMILILCDCTMFVSVDDDCGDNSDEAGCVHSCANGQYKCTSGRCIPDHWACDGDNDCGDFSDENVTCAGVAPGKTSYFSLCLS